MSCVTVNYRILNSTSSSENWEVIKLKPSRRIAEGLMDFQLCKGVGDSQTDVVSVMTLNLRPPYLQFFYDF